MNGLVVTILVGMAAGSSHTTDLGLGVGWHDGPRQVVIGLGPRLGHRYQPDPAQPWVVGGAIERLWLVVPTFGLSVEAGWIRPVGRWHPSTTLELAMYTGRMVKLTAEYPGPPLLPATSARLRLSPLVFDVGGASRVSALSLAPGLGLDTPLHTLAFSVSVFSLAHRW